MNISKNEYRIVRKGSFCAITYEPTKTKALKAAAELLNDDDCVVVEIHKEYARPSE